MLWRQNRLLALLPEPVRREWEPHLVPVELQKGQTIQLDGRHPPLYFPLSCVFAMSLGTPDSDPVLLRFTGTNFVVGLVNLLKVAPIQFTGVVCGSGHALRLDSRFFLEQLPVNFLSGEPRAVTMARIAKNGLQLATCAHIHVTAQRLARLLIQAHKCFGPNRPITLTQHELCTWLAVRRETVTYLLGEWTSQGLIQTHRGHLDILNAASLRTRACACLDVAVRFYDEEEAFWRSIDWPALKSPSRPSKL